ncbi:hypothetical protein E4T56_gene20298 [Termitomyces sp. T112]|nr:hypothetical protein E4T56_gene20298 [Termitomyces sp. T112]
MQSSLTHHTTKLSTLHQTTDLISQLLQVLLEHLTPTPTPPPPAEPAPTASVPISAALVTLQPWIPCPMLPDVYDENEIALSNALHSETEEPQCSSLDIQIPTLEIEPSSPTPIRYVMASSPSANSLHLDVEIETMDTQQTCGVTALLDSRATGLFLDSEFVKHHGLTMQPLPKPILVYNINRTPNGAGIISSIGNLVLHYWNHVECAVFAVTSLGRQDMILGFTWLHKHNSKVDWTKRECVHTSTTFSSTPKCWKSTIGSLASSWNISASTSSTSNWRSGAMEMDLVKVAGVAKWLEPENKKEVQAFLGFANFYWRFIQDFLYHAHPLFHLTGKDVA